MAETKYCNSCEHCSKHKIESVIYEDRCNYYCKYGGRNSMIEMTTTKDALVNKPNWCPIVQVAQIKEKKDKTPYEIKEALRSIKAFTKWEDIKVNEIYHLPPLVEGDKRKDIIITSKSQYFMNYKVLNSSNSYSVNTFYPSSLEVKFLVPHKLMKFEIITNGATK